MGHVEPHVEEAVADLYRLFCDLIDRRAAAVGPVEFEAHRVDAIQSLPVRIGQQSLIADRGVDRILNAYRLDRLDGAWIIWWRYDSLEQRLWLLGRGAELLLQGEDSRVVWGARRGVRQCSLRRLDLSQRDIAARQAKVSQRCVGRPTDGLAIGVQRCRGLALDQPYIADVPEGQSIGRVQVHSALEARQCFAIATFVEEDLSPGYVEPGIVGRH